MPCYVTLCFVIYNVIPTFAAFLFISNELPLKTPLYVALALYFILLQCLPTP